MIELLEEPWSSVMARATLLGIEEFSNLRREDFHKEMPNFTAGMRYARGMAILGTARRAQMPVLDEKDLSDLKEFLASHSMADICDECRVTPRSILPTQCQIYVDKSLRGTAQFGVEGTRNFLSQNHMVIDKDNEILDGHHRWLTGCTIDVDMDLPAFRIRHTKEELMNMLLEFSDSRHERNI